jgi:hypothetical protein
MKSPFMLRKLIIIFMAITVGLTSVACSSNNAAKNAASSPASSLATANNNGGARLGDGTYEVQQATYNDGNGEYAIMLLNTPAGVSPTYRNTNLQMARLTDEEVAAKKNAYLKIDNGQASMHIPADFKIEYIHNVTEQKTNAQTGQQETVVRQQSSSFWSPFAGSLAGSLAGQAIGNMLFRPQYYVPPVYSSGNMMGYGGYGNSYDRAVDNYRSRYNQAPAAVRNRTVLRTTGRLGNSNNSFGSNRPSTGQFRSNGSRSTGSGFGANRLGQSDNYRSRLGGGSTRSFGSSGARRSSGFGSRRR